MATFDYNPITGQLDLVGSGGGTSYIDGVVADSSLLPVTLGTPALDSVYLAKAGSGVWLINRRPAGLYVRVANNGVAADWTYLGAFPEVNADANWELYNSTDPTKELKFDLSGLPTGTTRTVSGPLGNGRMLVEGQPIGNTTPAAGTFTTLAANNGTVTTSTPAFTVEQTVNSTPTVFSLATFRITSTASNSNSSILECFDGATSIFNVRRNGIIIGSSGINSSNGFRAIGNGNSGGQVILSSNGHYCWNDSSTGTFGTQDLILRRDAAGVLAQYNAANPQAYNIYNTYSSATNHERGFLKWSGNVFQIGTEKGSGGGTARDLDFQTDGVSRLNITSGGNISLRGLTAVSFGNSLHINGGAIQLGNTGSGDAFQINRDAIGVMALRSGTQPHSLRIYNTSTSSNANFDRVNFRWASNEFIIDAEAGGTGTLRGIKIGSATSSLLGFYGVTPVDQPATVADPAGGGTIDTEARTAINAIIDRLQELGLIA